MLTIPILNSGQSHWTQRTAMGGRDYQLTLDWAQRSGAWHLALADQDGVAIATLRLVTNWKLLQRCVDLRRPPGELILLDAQGLGEEPTFSGLGDRWALGYLEPSELV
jgi:hypothetical protein